jgi:hypothetical protein
VYHVRTSVSLEPANQLKQEKWKRAYACFESVMELPPPGERSAFSQHAIQDPEVLRLVLDLLESEKRETKPRILEVGISTLTCRTLTRSSDCRAQLGWQGWAGWISQAEREQRTA